MKRTYTRDVTNRFLDASEKIIAELGLSEKDYFESVHIEENELIDMRADPTVNITMESLSEIINSYNVSPLWILRGIGEEFVDGKIIYSKNHQSSALKNVLQNALKKITKPKK